MANETETECAAVLRTPALMRRWMAKIGIDIDTITGTVPVGTVDGQLLIWDNTLLVYVPKLMSGDATLTKAGLFTLATVNSNVGTFGDSTHTVTATVNAKGLITAVSQNASALGANYWKVASSKLQVDTATTPAYTKIELDASADISLFPGSFCYINPVTFFQVDAANIAFTCLSGTFEVGASGGILFDNAVTALSGLITADNGFLIKDNLDLTKIATFQASGITTGTTRTFTFPDASGTLALTGSTISTTLTNTHILVGNASNVATDVALSGDATLANTGALTLASIGSATGPLGTALRVPVVTIDAKGRVTALTDIAIALSATGNVTGTLPGALTIAAGVVTNAMLAGSIDLTAKVTGTLPVGNGGTGIATATAHGVVLGQGTTTAFAVTAAGTNGQLFLGVTSADPAFATMSGDATITNAGAITIKTNVALAGSPTTTTQSAADNSTKIATTAYADAAAAARQSTTLTSAHLLVGNGSNVATDVALSGDATLANTGALTISNLAVTNAKIAAATIDLAAKVTGTLPGVNGGTGLATAAVGDMLYASATTPTWSRLAAGTVKQVLLGGASTPVWTNIDGWIADTNTWTWVSATTGAGGGVGTFKITGVDATGYLTKGTKVSWNDATNTPGYGVIASSTFSSDTTVTLIATSDYTMANHAFTAPRYSYDVNPQGFPTWFNWSPTLAGWSSNPTNMIHRYACVGTAITLEIRHQLTGTSNNTVHSATLPVAATTIANMAWGNNCRATDAGTIQAGVLLVLSAGTTVALNGILATNANTASGASSINNGYMVYEF